MLSPNGVSEPAAELRVLSPTAILGYGFPEASLRAGLARDPHVIPIPGASKAHHAKENLAALGWKLTDDEFAAIDKASSAVSA